MQAKEFIPPPDHYNYDKHEPIDVIKEWNLNFNLGNVVKYIARHGKKGSALDDLIKARNYLNHEIASMEKE